MSEDGHPSYGSRGPTTSSARASSRLPAGTPEDYGCCARNCCCADREHTVLSPGGEMRPPSLRPSWMPTLALSATLSAQERPSPPEDLRIARIQARMFRSDSGSITEDALRSGPAEFVNLAGLPPWGPSRQLVVVVEVEGPADRPLRGSVEVRATAGRAVTTSTVVIPWIEATGKTHAAFLANHSGCSPIALTVRLLSAAGRALQTEQRSIRLRCGD